MIVQNIQSCLVKPKTASSTYLEFCSFMFASIQFLPEFLLVIKAMVVINVIHLIEEFPTTSVVFYYKCFVESLKINKMHHHPFPLSIT